MMESDQLSHSRLPKEIRKAFDKVRARDLKTRDLVL